MTFLVLNLGFVRLPARAKPSRGLAGDMMGEIGCLYESQPTSALAGRLAHYLVSPEMKPPAPKMILAVVSCYVSEPNWPVVLSVFTNVVLRQFWCPLHRSQEVYGTLKVLNSHISIFITLFDNLQFQGATIEHCGYILRVQFCKYQH